MKLESLSGLNPQINKKTDFKLSGESRNLENISLPYVIENHTLMSPGVWNNFKYTKDTISNAYVNTPWSKDNIALFYEHSDKDSRDWVGDVSNIHEEDGVLKGNVNVITKELAMKLAYGARFGISPKIMGKAGNDKIVRNATFENFSIVLNPACKTTFLNSEIEAIKKEEKNMSEKVENVTNVETKNKEVTVVDYSAELSELKTMMVSLAETVKGLSEKKEELNETKVVEAKNEEVKQEVKVEIPSELTEMMKSMKADLDELKSKEAATIETKNEEEIAKVEDKKGPAGDIETKVEVENEEIKPEDVKQVKDELSEMGGFNNAFVSSDATDIVMSAYLKGTVSKQ